MRYKNKEERKGEDKKEEGDKNNFLPFWRKRDAIISIRFYTKKTTMLLQVLFVQMFLLPGSITCIRKGDEKVKAVTIKIKKGNFSSLNHLVFLWDDR